MQYGYTVLLLLRTLCITLPGYIHPDELFQSIEVMAGATLDTSANVPWEYINCDAPARSAVMPTLLVGLPYQLWVRITGSSPSPKMILMLPRMAMLTLTIMCDIAIFRICKKSNIDSSTPSLVLSTSWVYNVMSLRPLSNSVEHIMLVMLWWAYTECRHALKLGVGRMCGWCAVAGCLSALGIFTRFTFAIFAAPIVISAAAKTWMEPMYSKSYTAWNACVSSLCFVGGTAVSSILCLWYDDMFFGVKGITNRIPSPWTSFSYNMKTENLAQHGIHPRWQHILVNGHIMFGPLWILGFVGLGTLLWRKLWQTALKHDDPHRADTLMVAARADTLMIAASVLLLGTAGLSVAAHQEPRFLLPCLTPLAILGAALSDQLLSKRVAKWGFVLWICFNLVAGGFFGVFHQGGVLPFSSHHGSKMQPGAFNDHRSLWAFSNHSVVSSVTIDPPHLLVLGAYMVPHSVACGLHTQTSPQQQLPAPWCRKNAPSLRCNITETDTLDDSRANTLLEDLQRCLITEIGIACSGDICDTVREYAHNRRMTWSVSDTFSPHLSMEHLSLSTPSFSYGVLSNDCQQRG